MNPVEMLKAGCEILDPLLHPYGFVYREIAAGQGSGGYFACGKYVRNDRSLELHFRHSLGLVTYHIGSHSVTHESYMRELVGNQESPQYPGFSEDPLDGFRHLASDLSRYGQDFLGGSGEILVKAAAKEAAQRKAQEDDDMVRAVGDTRRRKEARQLFQAAKYPAVVQQLESLKYPERMTEAEKKMLEIAKRKSPPTSNPAKARWALFASKMKLFWK